MNFTLLAAYSLSVVTLLLLTPGPVVALITTTASQHGYRRAFLTLIGTNGASLVLIALAALMLAGVVSISAIWLGVLGLVGSLYIGVMAISGLRARDSNLGLSAPKRDNSGLIHGFLTGSLTQRTFCFRSVFSPVHCHYARFHHQHSDANAGVGYFDVTVLSFYIMVFKRWMPERFARRSVLSPPVSARGGGVWHYL